MGMGGVILVPPMPLLKMPATPRRTRGYCFTLNNYTERDEEVLKEVDCQYITWGRETAPSTGTKHLQGYVHFATEKTARAVRLTMGPRVHIEMRMGTIQQAVDYCQKDGDFFEKGQVRMESSGDQWKDVLEMAEKGEISAIKEQYPRLFITYYRTIFAIRAFNSKPLEGPLEHEWWYGPTGTGKSRRLWREYPEHFQKSANKWWDGYSGQEVIAIEEWEPKNECTASKLKIWADRYPFPAEIKGGTLQKIRPRKIIVTSNYTIKECFPNEQDYKPLLRRFKVVHFPSIFITDEETKDNEVTFEQAENWIAELNDINETLQF